MENGKSNDATKLPRTSTTPASAKTVKTSGRKISGGIRNWKMVNKSLPVKGRRRVLRRSLSYDTLPKMKNKHFICQPMAVPRRLTVPANELGFGITKQNMALICLALISFTAMLALAIIAPFFPTESSAKGMRESVNGLVFSVYALVYLILSPVISLIIPVVGSKLTLILGVFVAGVANILFGVLDKIDDLNMFTAFCFIVRVVEGVGGAAFSTATYTILMDEYSDNIGFAFSIVETATGLGLSLGPALGGFLYSIGGYGLPFFVLGAVMLINIPLCVVLVEDTKTTHVIKSPLQSYLKLLTNFKILINGFVVVVVAQLLSFLDPTIEPHLREIGLEPHHVSMVFLIMSATYTVSSPCMGWISKVVPRKFLMMCIGLFLLGILFVFLGPAEFLEIPTSFTQVAIVMAFFGVCYSIAFIPTFETMLMLAIKAGFAEDIGTYSLVSGLWSSFCSLGEIIGPVFGGVLTESLGFRFAASITGVCGLVMSVVCLATSICISEGTYFSEHEHKKPKKKTRKVQMRTINKDGSKKRHTPHETTPLLAA